MAPTNVLQRTVDDNLADMILIYEDIHRNPELSMQEFKTADKIATELERLGLKPQRFGGTGVVAVIENGDGPVVAYRADMDALPVTEQTNLPYASTTRSMLADGSETGVMHACGHDSHVTVGLYLTRVLLAHKDRWSGTVVMLFQPGEEVAQGARAMLDDGLWDRVVRPEAIYGQHLWPGQAGHVYLTPGTAMAMADSFKVTIQGRQSHGSRPEDGIDPIVLGAYMITRLQTVVAREIPGNQMAVVTVGTFHGGTKENIIPATAEFSINVRTFEEPIRTRVLAAIKRIILAEAQASGAPEPHIEQLYGTPRCYNDPQLAEALLKKFADEFGAERAHRMQAITGSEDVGYFGDDIGVPYVYWFFGGYSPEKLASETPPPVNHSPFFAPDDVAQALKTGVRAALIAIFSHVGK